MAEQTYVPPGVTSAEDAYIPYQNQIVTDGLFVLDVGIGEAGEIQQIEALRHGGSMVEAAKASLRSWKFRPASENGKPAASRLTVAFLQPPTIYVGIRAVPPKDFVPVIPPEQSGSEFDTCWNLVIRLFGLSRQWRSLGFSRAPSNGRQRGWC